MPTVPVMANTIELGDAIPNTSTAPQPPQYAPIVNLVASGSQSARIEWIVFTWVNPFGESLASPEVKMYVPANFVVSVYPYGSHPDTFIPDLTGWNCYISTSGPGTETKQNTSLLGVPLLVGGLNSGVLQGGNVFQEPATGLIAGSALPTAATNVPNLVSGISNLANTPPATGNISVFDSTGFASLTAKNWTNSWNFVNGKLAVQVDLDTIEGPQQGVNAITNVTSVTLAGYAPGQCSFVQFTGAYQSK